MTTRGVTSQGDWRDGPRESGAQGEEGEWADRNELNISGNGLWKHSIEPMIRDGPAKQRKKTAVIVYWLNFSCREWETHEKVTQLTSPFTQDFIACAGREEVVPSVMDLCKKLEWQLS